MEPTSSEQANGRAAAKRHPMARVFHVLFKGTAAAYFVFCEILLGANDFVTNFIVLLVFVCADFWTVKNVTGRLLVGLRWWNDVTDDAEGWRFETLDEGQRSVDATDKTVFWSALVGNVVVWALFTVWTLLSPSQWEYLLICAIALIMGGSNAYGYFKCSREARNAVRQYAEEAIASVATTAVAAATRGQRT